MILPEATAKQFAYQFQLGMTTPRRQKYIGDSGRSHPEKWTWGGRRGLASDEENIHMLLMFYGSVEKTFKKLLTDVKASLPSGGLKALDPELTTNRLPDHKEHFGFRDGISNAGIEGVDSGPNLVAPGEFFLGYKNEYDLYAPRPLIDFREDPQNLLPKDAEGSGDKDLGRNGSYLVFRQLSQDVYGFWNKMRQAAQGSPLEAVALAAKMVGRWPNGTPLAVSPDREKEGLKTANDFNYHDGDRYGLKCPIGAHVRRANPRDSLDPDPGSERSLQINRRHRIIRRGRPYGPAVASLTSPENIANGSDDGEERGLHFVCFNVTFNRQFEFIADTWINSSKFAGLYDESDPLLGDRTRLEVPHSGDTDAAPPECHFTVPATPLRHRVTGFPRFVRTVGGAHFFMPGLKALHYLATI